MALNLSRNTQVFISTVNGVHVNGGGAIEVDTITAGTGHAVNDVITCGTGATAVSVIVTSVNGSGGVTGITLANNGRGSGSKSNNAALSQTTTSGSGSNFACIIDGDNAQTTTRDGGRTPLGLFKGNERDANTF